MKNVVVYISAAVALFVSTSAHADTLQRQDTFLLQARPIGVYDAKSKFIGQVISPGNIGVSINGNTLLLPFNWAGIQEVPPTFFFTSSNCSGTKYMDAGSFPPFAAFTPNATQPYSMVTTEGTIYYPKQPARFMNVFSMQRQGSCTTLQAANGLFGGEVQVFQVRGWITPPFNSR